MELIWTICWVISSKFLTFFFSTVIEVERSKPSVDPGTIICRGLRIHVFIKFGSNSFHVQEASNKKLSLVSYNLTLGSSKRILKFTKWLSQGQKLLCPKMGMRTNFKFMLAHK